MKKILLVTMLFALSFGAYSIYDQKNNSTNEALMLENVEALSAGEGPTQSWRVVVRILGGWDCYPKGNNYCPGAPF